MNEPETGRHEEDRFPACNHDNGYAELPITGAHAVSVVDLPSHHRDPFDRLLVAQATSEGITLLTADPAVAAYAGPICKV